MAGTVVASTINNDTGLFSTNNAYLGIAKAWVQWTGSTGTVNSSFNVSSITRAGSGKYTINFTTAMLNANYCGSLSCGFSSAGIPSFFNESWNGTRTTSAYQVEVQNYNSTASVDPQFACVSVFSS